MIAAILGYVVGTLISLVTVMLTIRYHKKLHIGPITAIWSDDSQQVTRLKPSLGTVFLIKDEHGQVMRIESGGKDAIDSLKRAMKKALVDGLYYAWLRDMVLHNRSIHIEVLANGLNDTAKRHTVKKYLAGMALPFNAHSKIDSQKINSLIHLEDDNESNDHRKREAEEMGGGYTELERFKL